jgi:hypothetical protein
MSPEHVMTPERALQIAITGILVAAPRLAPITGQQVYDELPAPEKSGGPKPPWIFLGPINMRRLEACGRAWTATIRLYAASTAFGRKQVWDIAHGIDDALEGAEPELPDGFVLGEPLRVIQAGDVVSPIDPKTVFVDVQTTITPAPEE